MFVTAIKRVSDDSIILPDTGIICVSGMESTFGSGYCYISMAKLLGCMYLL